MKTESFKAENSVEIVWLRLNRLKSKNLCEKVIRSKYERKGQPYKDKVGDLKAIGLSSAIESAIGYWEQNSKSLNSRVLSRYYFMLQWIQNGMSSSPGGEITDATCAAVSLAASRSHFSRFCFRLFI